MVTSLGVKEESGGADVMRDADDAVPLVSIVIPTYNRPGYLRQALASAVAQSLRDIEIIVQDNASPQDPTPLIEAFNDPRIRLRRNPENVGLFRNIVAGCTAARGRYLATLHDDDLWKADFLATLVEPLEKDPSLVLAFCDHDIIGPDGAVDQAATEETTRRWGRDHLSRGVHRPFDHLALINRAICSASAAVFRRDAIDWAAIPLNVGLGIDLYVSYLAARSGKGCWYEPARLAQYREHTASTTASKRDLQKKLDNARDAVQYWSIFLNDRSVARNRRYFEMKRGMNALVIVSCLARQRRWREAFAELAAALREGVLRPRILVVYAAYAHRLRRITA
jgi:glycosyltransferase involved in cell wall biosynthesis